MSPILWFLNYLGLKVVILSFGECGWMKVKELLVVTLEAILVVGLRSSSLSICILTRNFLDHFEFP